MMAMRSDRIFASSWEWAGQEETSDRGCKVVRLSLMLHTSYPPNPNPALRQQLLPFNYWFTRPHPIHLLFPT